MDEPPDSQIPRVPVNQLFNMRVASAREMLREGFSPQEVIAIHGSCVLRQVLEMNEHDAKRRDNK